jgi:hypothetical protein
MQYTSGIHHPRYGYIKYPITKTKESYNCSSSSYKSPLNYSSAMNYNPTTNYIAAPKKIKYNLGYLPPVCNTGCPCPTNYSTSYPDKSYNKCYTKKHCRPGYVKGCHTSYTKPTTYSDCNDSCSCSYTQANYNNKQSCYKNYITPPTYSSRSSGYQGYTAFHGGPNASYPSYKKY